MKSRRLHKNLQRLVDAILLVVLLLLMGFAAR